MSEVEQVRANRKALEAFVVDNAELERLEALLDRFNIFEAVGLVRQEIRHSTFLAFLLNPRESHRLGDAFAKRLLQGALTSRPDKTAPVSPIDLSLWDLGQMEVQREWQHIDIFLLDERNRLAVIIENKIGTSEHSDQLQRYYETVSQNYPGYKIVGLYLTPTEEEPSHTAYLTAGYGLVCEILDSLAQSRASVENVDLQTLVSHYTQMLRRNIVGDSEIARLCRQIYLKHQRALDLIYEHRPDIVLQVKTTIEKIIREEPSFVLEGGGKNKTRFAVVDWDRPPLLTASGWTKSRRILMFEFWHYDDGLWLLLIIGPGSEEARQKLFGMSRSAPDTFEVPESLGKWTTIFSRTFFENNLYEEAADDEREQEIRRRWAEFLHTDLPQITAALNQESWIWQ